MRAPLIAGNWKMNKTVSEAVDFVNQIKTDLPDPRVQETVIAAPTLALTEMVAAARDSPLKIAAENCYYKNAGAYTGETSPTALYHAHIHHVILGHSERRRLFNETDELINKKVKAALAAGVCPIVCCDETMGRMITSDAKPHWVVSRVLADLKDLTPAAIKNVTMAYEPTWAIGTGQAADPSQAAEGCYLIRQTLAAMYGNEVAQDTRILYGGSVNPDNIQDLMASPDIDGVLVGGASLDAASFLQLVNG